MENLNLLPAQLSRPYAPDDAEVRDDIVGGIRAVLRKEGGATTLGDTIIVIDEDDLSSLHVSGERRTLGGEAWSALDAPRIHTHTRARARCLAQND